MRFLADFMLGKLCRELRLLGIDCTYQSKPLEALEIVKRGQEEERILLTRNTKLKEREGVIFIDDDNYRNQVKLILNRFPMIKIEPFTRCLFCNAVLIKIEKETVKSQIPFFIYQTKKRFYSCPECQKIYWQGSHYNDMKTRLKVYLTVCRSPENGIRTTENGR